MSESDRPDEQVIDGDADLDAILLALDTAGRELPVEAIREARRCRNAIIPKLIQVLQTASAAVRSGATHEGQAPFFALFLLTEFQAKEALPAILEAVSLPGEQPFAKNRLSGLPRRRLVLALHRPPGISPAAKIAHPTRRPQRTVSLRQRQEVQEVLWLAPRIVAIPEPTLRVQVVYWRLSKIRFVACSA